MRDRESGSSERYVDTPSGGYRIIRTSTMGSKVVEVLYFDKNGVERREEIGWKKESLWSRMIGGVGKLFRWFAGRL